MRALRKRHNDRAIVKLVKSLVWQSVPWQPVGIGRIIYTYYVYNVQYLIS